jgi:hypothetical protein
MRSAWFGNGRCSAMISAAGAFIHVAISSDVVKMTGRAFGWTGATIALGSVVRKAKRSFVVSPSLTLRTEVRALDRKGRPGPLYFSVAI